MEIIPRSDNVVITATQKKHEEKGIIIPEEEQNAPTRGIIVAVGPDVPDDLKEGDEVLFAQYSEDTVQLGGETYCVVREESIRGKISP